MIAEHDGQPGHALASNQSHLDLLAARLNSDNGREAALGEVDRIDSLVGLLEMLPNREGYGFEMRFQQVEIVGLK